MKKIYFLLLIVLGVKVQAQNCIPNTSSLTFNGTTNYVDLAAATSIAPDSAITVEAWINPSVFAANSYQNSIINKDAWTGVNGEGGFALRCGGNGILSFVICGRTFASTASLSWKEISSPVGTLQLNTWQHVAGTFDGSTINIYVNGTLVGSTAFIGMIRFPDAYALKLGRCPETSGGQGRFFNGKIDEARVWERALSATEIAANANNHINVAGQNRLIGYWRLNEGTGTTTADISSSALGNATLQGATWNTSVPFAGGLNMSNIYGNANVSAMMSVDYYVTPSTLSSYVWSISNGAIVSGQGNDTVTVIFAGTGAGQLTVIGADTACADTSTLNVTITPVGINNVISNNNELSIAQSENAILFTNNTTSIQNISFYNALGMIVGSIRINDNATSEISTEAFAKGVYIYTNQSAQSKSITGKFMLR